MPRIIQSIPPQEEDYLRNSPQMFCLLSIHAYPTVPNQKWEVLCHFCTCSSVATLTTIAQSLALIHTINIKVTIYRQAYLRSFRIPFTSRKTHIQTQNLDFVSPVHPALMQKSRFSDPGSPNFTVSCCAYILIPVQRSIQSNEGRPPS